MAEMLSYSGIHSVSSTVTNITQILLGVGPIPLKLPVFTAGLSPLNK